MPFIFFLLLLFAMTASVQGETMIFDASVPNTPGTKGVQHVVRVERRDGLLLFTNTDKYEWPGVEFQGQWSIGLNEVLVIELVNPGSTEVRVQCQLRSPDVSKGDRVHFSDLTLASGEKRRWEIQPPRQLSPQLQEKMIGMFAFPGGINIGQGKPSADRQFDPTDFAKVSVVYYRPTQPHTVGIRRIFTAPPKLGAQIASINEAINLPPEKFFPMIDRYGQYIHADWPGKIKSDADLKKNRETEEKELTAAPERKDRNQYGGWSKGPKLKATGHFYTTKHKGDWWLVDPEGCLFWSHGIAHIVTGGYAVTERREHFFAELPDESCKGPLAWQTDKTRTYHFYESNMKLKYEGDWKRSWDEMAQRRLHAWGVNTIGNWSDTNLYKLPNKTPYTEPLKTSAPSIGGSTGVWEKFPDPFSPEFRSNLAKEIEKKRETSDDPWCIGYFVDNELGWGNDTSLSVAALISPASQPAKIAVVDMLRKKYNTIKKFNDTWNTSHADWDVLLASTSPPDVKNETIKADLREGYTLIADEYFRVIRDEVKKGAPNKLYLGCRFITPWWKDTCNNIAIQISGKYCDVVSFNIYDDLSLLTLPQGFDKAIMISEFSIGASDRGMFHGGYPSVANQQERAKAYVKYVEFGLKHPNIVGTHWWLYVDPLACDHYQFGIVDICDTPYPELVKAVKYIGTTMYNLRSGRKK